MKFESLQLLDTWLPVLPAAGSSGADGVSGGGGARGGESGEVGAGYRICSCLPTVSGRDDIGAAGRFLLDFPKISTKLIKSEESSYSLLGVI